MTKDEIARLVTKIANSEGSEEQIDEWLTLLEANVPHPSISDLIFHSELTPEEVVEQALSYMTPPLS